MNNCIYIIITIVVLSSAKAYSQSVGQQYYYLNNIAQLPAFEDEDHDNDGIANIDDPFPYNPNEWLDTDGDGFGNQTDLDDDGDGMPDSWELSHNLLPLISDANNDYDQDGSTNFQEYQNNTNPNNPLSCSNNCVVAAAPAPAQITFPAADTLSDQVDAISGMFNVSNSGAAEYTIPLDIPQGTAGVAPKVALNYNSSRGNGLLGQGWSLGAFSAITTCPHTRAIDGKALPIMGHSPSDRLCLDGERLVLVNPAGQYNGPYYDGVQYRTETDGFKKIVSYFSSALGHVYFKVWNKDGSVSEYGNSSDSYTGYGSLRVYAQNRIEDSLSVATSANNPVVYTYEIIDGELRAKKIAYAYGNTLTPNAWVEFTYENRPDNFRNSIPYVSAERHQRLSTITAKGSVAGNPQSIRTYNLTYQNVTARSNKTSKLASITECQGSICLPPTSFTWSDNGIDFQLTSGTNISGFSNFPLSIALDKKFQPADFNGDGNSDLIWLEPEPNTSNFRFKGSPSNGVTLTTSTTQSLNTHEVDSWTVYDFNHDGYPDILFTENGSLKLYKNTLISGQRSFAVAPVELIANMNQGTETNLDDSAWFDPKGVFADINADGLIDILYNKAIYYMERDSALTNGPYKFGSPNIITLGSPSTPGTINNAVKYHLENYGTNPGYISAFKTVDLDSAQFGDFNGDGLPDLVVNAWFKTSNAWIDAKVILASDGSQTNSGFNSFIHYRVKSFSQMPTDFNFSEFNGRPAYVHDADNDGLADVGYLHIQFDYDVTYNFVTYWNTTFGRGASSGFLVTSGSGSQEFVTPPDLEFIDINQDGFIDMVYREVIAGDDKLMARYNNGSGVYSATSIQIATITDTNLGNHVFMDLNGDAVLDFVDFNSKVWIGNPASNTVYNKIVKITDGLGSETNVTYSSFANPSVYTREFDAPTVYTTGFPVIDIFAPITVVSAVSTSSPTAADANNLRSISYKYQGLKVQPAGRGGLGFRVIETTDVANGNVVTNTFRQDFPFIGALASSQTHVSGQTTALSETINTYTKLSHINGMNPPYFVALTQSVQTQRVAASSATASSPLLTISGDLTVTTTTKSNFDSYGNAGTESIVVAGDGATNTTTMTNVYTNNANSWLLGKLTKSTVTRQESSSTITNVTDFTYDSVTGVLLTQVKEPLGTPEIKLTTSYQYDAFGNPNRITETSAYGTRYSRTEYDATGRFVDKTYNGLEQLVSEVLDRDAYGSPTTIKGLNGKLQYFRYGTFGNAFFTAANDGNSVTTSKRLCTAVACPAGAVYRVQTVGADGSLQNAYADKLGREIRSEVKSFNGTLSFVDTQYDGAGRVKKVSAPYFSGGTVYWSTNDYDNLGRTIKVVDTNSGVSTNVVSRYVNGSVVGIQQVSKNQLNQNKTTIVNGKNQTIRVLDHNGGYINSAYDAAGNLIQTVTDGGTATITYDVLGRRLTLDDPDQGLWNYQYNAFGDMTQQTDSTGAKTTMAFDVLGRISGRQDIKANLTVESNTTWTYGTNASIGNVGQLTMEEDSNSGYIKVYAYDNLGRPKQTITSLGVDGIEGDYAEYATYDQFGRVFQQIDPTAKGIQYVYNAHGYQEKLVEATNTSKIYHTVAQTNASGQVTNEAMHGTQFQMARGYNPTTGLPSTIVATSSYTMPRTLLDINLTFNAVGSLTSRTRNVAATSTLPAKTLTETFTYDQLNRLASIASPGQTTQTATYDATGNILTKTGVGTYTYGAGTAGPHAVTGAGGNTYTYDAIGNMLAGGGRSATYNAFRKPVSVTKGTNTTTFEYGPDRSHYKRVDSDGVNVTKTLTVGSVEFITVGLNPTTTKRYIGGVAVVTDTSSTHEEHYLLKDHLGSVAAIVKADALDHEQLDYDAYGKRRSLWTLSELLAADSKQINKLTTTGFTGHEMVDGVGLIHMQGRVYDPTLGRFLSADPYITEMDNTQNMNRYSYVYNNPLTLVDPSGFCEGSMDSCAAEAAKWYSGCGPACLLYDDAAAEVDAMNTTYSMFMNNGPIFITVDGNFATTSSLLLSGAITVATNAAGEPIGYEAVAGKALLWDFRAGDEVYGVLAQVEKGGPNTVVNNTTVETNPLLANLSADERRLALLIFSEGSEDYLVADAMEGIAAVIMNRLNTQSPDFKNKTLEKLIENPVQFEAYKGDLWLAAENNQLEGPNVDALTRAVKISKRALSNNLNDPTGGATFFYSGDLDPPPVGFYTTALQSGRLEYTVTLGGHHFFKDTQYP